MSTPPIIDEPRGALGVRDIAGIAFRLLLTLPLAALFFVKLDMFTTLVWVFGLIVFISSVSRVIRELFARKQRVIARLVVALAGVVLFPLACLNLGRALGDAHRETRELAARAQAHCAANRACPTHEALCGAPPAPDPYREGLDATCVSAGSAGIRYPVRYGVTTDFRRFTVSLAPNIDEQRSFVGGVDVPLVEKHLLDGIDVAAPRAPDAPADAGP